MSRIVLPFGFIVDTVLPHNPIIIFNNSIERAGGAWSRIEEGANNWECEWN